ncbi:MAG: glycerate kinase [Bacteroidota bacterium]
MKILIAPDKFKGSLSASEVGEAIKSGLIKSGKNLEIIVHPMADGGDGSLEVLSTHLDLSKQTVPTVDPLGREMKANYYTSSEVAFLEVASASGLVLLKARERNPMLTSSRGTGLLIADAIQKGFQKIYLFLGGSATNDAGIGIASALGFEFFDYKKNRCAPIGLNLSKIKFIQRKSNLPLHKIEFHLLCDVNNPFFGKDGAAYVYAPQKGASKIQVEELDQGLVHFNSILKKEYDWDVSQLLGAGAAGGIGGGLVGLLNADLKKGFETIAQLTELEKQIIAADHVVSGEGKLDAQSLRGKVVQGIAQLCKKHNKPLTLFVGENNLSKTDLQQMNVSNIFEVMTLAKNPQDAMHWGFVYLEQLSEDFLV